MMEKKKVEPIVEPIKEEVEDCTCTNLMESQGKIYCKECGKQK